MLLVLTGSSGVGKSTAAGSLRGRPGLHVHDSDEGGVPSHADTAWRQRTLERWVQQAIDLESSGDHLLLSGQSPLGELLAVPSLPRLGRWAVALLDADDATRNTRLRARDPGVWSPDQLVAFDRWAHWHRQHAVDPRYHPAVITAGGWPAMRWDRWAGWERDDPRWRVDLLRADGSAAESAALVARWVDGALAEGAAG